MSNDEMIKEIYNEVCNKNRFLENDNECLRRNNDSLKRENAILLDIINNKVNKIEAE